MDLEERTVHSDLPFAFERVRTSAECIATLDAYRGRFSHLLLVSARKRGGIHFADELRPIDGQSMGKLISSVASPQSLEVIVPGYLKADLKCMARRSRALSKGKAVKSVVAIDRSRAPEWTAALLDGYIRCLGSEDRVEVALANAMPPAGRASIAIWRNGQPFSRINC